MPTDRDLEDAHKEFAQAPYESERQELADIDATIGELTARRAYLVRSLSAAGKLRERSKIEWAATGET